MMNHSLSGRTETSNLTAARSKNDNCDLLFFHSLPSRLLLPRPGETVISKFEAVEDTKGNNGATGERDCK